MAAFLEAKPWVAGGYALWLTSTTMSVLAPRLVDQISEMHPGTTTVIDGHLTAIGNLFKEHPNPTNENILRQIAYDYSQRLLDEPLEVRIVDVAAKPSRPSQTVYFGAEDSAALSALRQEVATRLNVAPPTIPPHFSLVYNLAANVPLTDQLANDQIIPLFRQRIRLPFFVPLDGMVAVRTQGTPSQWINLW